MLAEDGFKGGRRIVELLRQPAARLDLKGADARVAGAIGRLLKRRLVAKEREFYRFHLLHGGPVDGTGGLQQQLAILVTRTLSTPDFAWSTSTVGALAKQAHAEGDAWGSLASRLERIRACESVMAPAAALFNHLLGFDERPFDQMVKRLREAWGEGLRTVRSDETPELRAELGAGDADAGARWCLIASALSSGAYNKLLETLIEQNGAVMSSRGGAPWVDVSGGRLRVRFRDENGDLPKKTELPNLWRFPYFLDSVRIVADAVKEV